MRRNGARPHRIILNSRVPRYLGGHDAVTLGWWTFVAGESCSATLRAHENRHLQQMYWCGVILWPVAYLGEFLIRIIVEMLNGNFRSTITRAYHRISWEQDAYRWGPLHSTEFDPLP